MSARSQVFSSTMFMLLKHRRLCPFCNSNMFSVECHIIIGFHTYGLLYSPKSSYTVRSCNLGNALYVLLVRLVVFDVELPGMHMRFAVRSLS